MRSNGRSPPPSSHRAASWSTPRQLRRRRCGPTTPVATALVLFAATLSAAPATSARRSPVAPPPAEGAITCFVPSSDAHGRLGGGGGPSLAPDVVRPPLPPSRGPPLCGWGGSVMPSSTRGWTDASSTSRRTSTSTILHGARRGHKHHGGSGGVGRRGDRGDDGDVDGDRGRRRRRGGGDGRDPRGEERDGDERELGHEHAGRHFYSRKSLSDRSLLSVGGGGAEADVERRRVFRKLCGAADVARPSRVQALAWPVLLGDDGDEGARHAIVADQTGSGKTLAYLIPLLLRMLVDEKENEKNEVDGRPTNAPRILILAPTTELAHQLYGVCRRLSGRGIPFRTEVATSVPPPPNRGATEEDDDDGNAGGGGGRSRSSPDRRGNDVDSSAHTRDQIRRLKDPKKSPVDVLVATPGRVASLVRGGVLDLTHLQSLVLDEVDVLMIDETFGPQLRAVGAKAPLSTRFVFVTATLPDSVVADVRKEFPDVVTVKGPGLHRVAPTLKEYLVDVSVDNRLGGTSNRDAKACFDVKAEELLGALRRTKCERTLVFCNTVESCRMVENFLKRRDRGEKSYRVGSYHGAMSPQARTRELALFSRGGTADRGGGGGGGRRRWGGGKGGLAASKDRVDRVLVCTDRAARGVDFGGAAVDHVVVFDFPSDPAEYVRRVGRTARAGRGGTSTVLAYGWQLPVARGIMGSRLEAGTAGGDDALVGGPFRDGRRGKEEDEDDDDAFHSRKRRRRRGSPGDAISDNIASGKLWKERKPR